MRSKEVEDNNFTSCLFYDCKQALYISENNEDIESGIFFDGVKITSVEEWKKAIKEFRKRKKDYIPKQVIRDKIKELNNMTKDVYKHRKQQRYTLNEIQAIKGILKEILGE